MSLAETEKAVLVKFTTEKGTKSIWIPKSVLKDTQKEQDFKDYNKFIADNSLLKDCMPFWIFSNCRLRGLCTPAA